MKFISPPEAKPWKTSQICLGAFTNAISSQNMANFRRFRPEDLNKLSKCNLDPFTETYELSFYLQYYAKWPSLFQVAEDQDGNIIGYSASQLQLHHST